MEGEPDSIAPTRILLHEYAKSGATDLVLALLDEKADPNEKSSLGDTALIWGELFLQSPSALALCLCRTILKSRPSTSVQRR
jgi:hypothetical protein